MNRAGTEFLVILLLAISGIIVIFDRDEKVEDTSSKTRTAVQCYDVPKSLQQEIKRGRKYDTVFKTGKAQAILVSSGWLIAVNFDDNKNGVWFANTLLPVEKTITSANKLAAENTYFYQISKDDFARPSMASIRSVIRCLNR